MHRTPIVRDWCEIDSWQPWPDFNHKKLENVSKDVVEAPRSNAPPDISFSKLGRTFSDEDGFEHQVLSSETIPTVNAALKACKTRAQL